MNLVHRAVGAVVAGVLIASSAPAWAQQKITAAHGLLQLGLSYAAESSLPLHLGYWKDEGLAVEVLTTPGATVGTQLLITGGADVLIGSANAAMSAVHRGADLQIYYTVRRGDVFGVGFPEGAGVASIKDLKGKTVGVSSLASFTTRYIKNLLQKAGMSASDVSIVEIGVGGRAAAAIKSNRVQAVSLFDEAFLGLEQAGIKFVKIIKDPAAAANFTGSLVARGADLKNRRAVLVGVARGIAKAHVFAATNPAAVARIHWKVYPQTAPRVGVTDEEIKKAVNVLAVNRQIQAKNAFGTGRYGDLPPERMQQAVDFLIALGELPEKIDIRKYYTNDLIDEINNFDEQAIKEQARNFTMPR